MFLDFIEIGTSDFDTEIEKNDNKIGLSIDAVKYYVDKLPNKSGCTKINNGISNFNGNITINYVSIENIKKYHLPWWVRGCNSVNHYHPTVSKLLLDKGLQIKDIATNYTIPCKTIIFLLDEYNVHGFYLLKVDTEGHDSTILKHFLENNKRNYLLPHKIIFESNVLTNKEDVDNIIKISENIGYDLILREGDTIIKLNLNKIHKTFIFTSVISNYYIEDYPKGYDPNNLPHKNTLEEAKKYCMKYKCSGITYKYNRYEVRNGKYLNYNKNPKLLSWILL
tara:strand:+ start:1358 stop:2197 length:840 start_codon:yes stop_codon:yes gene_type:complete